MFISSDICCAEVSPIMKRSLSLCKDVGFIKLLLCHDHYITVFCNGGGQRTMKSQSMTMCSKSRFKNINVSCYDEANPTVNTTNYPKWCIYMHSVRDVIHEAISLPNGVQERLAL